MKRLIPVFILFILLGVAALALSSKVSPVRDIVEKQITKSAVSSALKNEAMDAGMTEEEADALTEQISDEDLDKIADMFTEDITAEQLSALIDVALNSDEDTLMEYLRSNFTEEQIAELTDMYNKYLSGVSNS